MATPDERASAGGRAAGTGRQVLQGAPGDNGRGQVDEPVVRKVPGTAVPCSPRYPRFGAVSAGATHTTLPIAFASPSLALK